MTQEDQLASQRDKANRFVDNILQNASTPQAFEAVVAQEYIRLRAREVAQQRADAEDTTSGYQTLEIAPLSDLLALPEVPIQWRIFGLAQVGHNVTIAARYKVGKTTLITNLLKPLVDGGEFLGFPVRPVEGNVVVYNHELSDAQFTSWLRRAGIKNTHKIIPVNLRGKGLYLQDEDAQNWSIELLRKYNAEVWIIDPLQAALRGTVNDDSVASDWIAAADRVKAEAGVSELVLVTHTGHLAKADIDGRSANERSAGSARWSGWPDALWVYTKDDAGTRYLSAEGRDIQVDEFGLDFNSETLALTSLGEGTGRADRKATAPYRALLALFTDNPERHISRPQIEQELRINNKAVTTAIRDAELARMIEQCECDHSPGQKGRKPNTYILTGSGRWALKQFTDITDNTDN